MQRRYEAKAAPECQVPFYNREPIPTYIYVSEPLANDLEEGYIRHLWCWSYSFSMVVGWILHSHPGAATHQKFHPGVAPSYS